MTFKGKVLRNNTEDNLICDNAIGKSYLKGVMFTLQAMSSWLFALTILTHCRYFLTRSLRSSLFLVGFNTDSFISSSFALSSLVKESKVLESSYLVLILARQRFFYI